MVSCCVLQITKAKLPKNSLALFFYANPGLGYAFVADGCTHDLLKIIMLPENDLHKAVFAPGEDGFSFP